MFNFKDKVDLPRTTFLFIFIITMMLTSAYVLKPFFIGFSWASMVVIATWPLLLKLTSWFGGRKGFSVFLMIFISLLFIILPVFFIINMILENCFPLIDWLNKGHLKFPQLYGLIDIPLVGKKLFSSYQQLLNNGSRSIIRYFRPYLGRTTEFFVVQAGYLSRFILHLFCMFFFSSFLYWRGEKIVIIIRHFAFRLGSTSGDRIVLLAGKAIRSVALGIIVTSLVQVFLGILGLIISGFPFYSLFIIPIVIFSLLQLGTLPILLPITVWFYFSHFPIRGTILLIWSIIICILDNILRTMLIRLGADFPSLLLLSGMIGGVISFGLIGLFLGPVVLVISYQLVMSWIKKTPLPNFISNKKIKKINIK